MMARNRPQKEHCCSLGIVLPACMVSGVAAMSFMAGLLPMRMTFIAAPAHEPDKACSVCLFYLGNERHGESPGRGALRFPLWPTALHQGWILTALFPGQLRSLCMLKQAKASIWHCDHLWSCQAKILKRQHAQRQYLALQPCPGWAQQAFKDRPCRALFGLENSLRV